MALDLNDKSPNGNTLTNHSATDSVDVPFSQSGANTDSAGITTTQYLSAADSASLSITGDFTIEGWMKITSTVGGNSILAGKYNTPSNLSYMFFYDNDSPSLAVQLSSDGSTNYFSQRIISALVINTWYHIAVAYSASNGRLRFYLNGVQQGADITGAPNSIFDGNALLTLGAYNNGSSLSSDNIRVDEVRVWSVERSAADILANYQTQLYGNETGLAAYYPFNVVLPAPIAIAETSAGSDATPAIVNSTVLSDASGAGADAVVSGIAVIQADTGAGSDAISSPSVTIPVTETGAGADTILLNITVQVTDASGQAIDSAQISVPVADAGTALDIITDIRTVANVTDVSVGADNASVSITVEVSDSLTGIDTIAVHQQRILNFVRYVV